MLHGQQNIKICGRCSLSQYNGVTWLKAKKGRRGEIDCWC